MDDPGDPLHRQPAAVDRLRDRSQAFQAFATLAEALTLLHGDGVIHRALTPRAICGHANPSLSVKLDQFQFSAMIAAWLRTGAQVNPEATRWLASIPCDELVFLPPERLGPLFGEPVRHLESFSADVFGLGMTGASWFAGPPDAAACARVVSEGRYSRSEHEALITSVRQRLMAADLPRPLALLIAEMLQPVAGHRPTSALAVSDILHGSYGSILSQLEEREQELQPLNLWFMKWTAERLYFQYRATQTHPDRMDEQEYAQLIAEDLEGGEVCWSPDGFLPWSEERDEEARRRCADARVLLVGKRFAYFCQYYQDYDNSAADDRVLLIKYPCERWLVREHIASIPRRAAPPVRAKFFSPPARVRIPPARSWKPLVEPVRFEKKADESADPVVAANWLVRIQQGRLDAQTYDFVRVSTAAPAIVLRGEWRRPYDPASDRAAFEELARRSGLVDEMGDFFDDVARRAEAANEDAPIFVIGDATGQDLGIRLEFEKREDARTVRFRPKFAGGDRGFPEAGRVWVEQGAQGHVLGRQRRAARLLSLNLDLVNQLRSPRSVDLAVSHAEDVQTDAETRALLQRIDGAWPLFCVQGPPGTGKTFLSSLVVYSALRREPFGRILVSAQAHHALDNRRSFLRAARPDVSADVTIREHASRCSADAGARLPLPSRVGAGACVGAYTPLS